MSQDLEPPESLDTPTNGPTTAEIQAAELLRRSPHPYHRRQADLRSLDPSLDDVPYTFQDLLDVSSGNWRTYLATNDRKRRKITQSPSDSGTEADDEGYGFVKALPAPPIRPRKGLRDTRGSGADGSATPLLTPSLVDEESQKYSIDYFKSVKDPSQREPVPTDPEVRAARERYLKRRRAEIIRRTTEIALLGLIGVLVLRGCSCWEQLIRWQRAELLTYTVVLLALLGLYPLRLLYYSKSREDPANTRSRRCIRIPAAFDPAPILYPATIPVLISISLLSGLERILLPNIILSLAAVPSQMVPFGRARNGFSMVHWFFATLPLIASQNTEIPSKLFPSLPYKLKISPLEGLDPELLVSLFALHQALLPPLHYLTTTSLLPTELHLLSIGLINLFLFSDSPQTEILKTLLWLGGLAIFLLCGRVLKWGVALARIPRWRFRRAGRIIGARQSFLQILNQRLMPQRSRSMGAKTPISDSDADEDNPMLDTYRHKPKGLRLSLLNTARNGFIFSDTAGPSSAVERRRPRVLEKENGQTRKRRNTLPANMPDASSISRQPPSNRRRSKSMAQSFLSLTPTEAATRKWIYAGYFYSTVFVLIFGPIRYFIGRYSLYNHEPVGWAIGYLLGNIQSFRFWVLNWDLENWIALPPMLGSEDKWNPPSGLAGHLRSVVLGEANTRLLLCGYFLAIICVGLLVVFRLSAVVEVDTRRKVFHGMMVAMLLPTIYVDPAFISLALIIVLAVFLLLDLIRASQLPPLSRPIATFLTPYVDGRDLRGPVVVSHIFLLIGCAIPLWLALAGVHRTGQTPWQGWEVVRRDVSMVAGVVCVGMGDAAASLIGRRYGRKKWPWAGGKSIEGSAAFALAVTVGLLFGKFWLVVGQFNQQGSRPDGGSRFGTSWMTIVGKAAACAAGASLNEAVLTGGNDNVIVPVVLWLLVRGIKL
ncbi:hypothetical protein GQ43DRAFT_466933 [Delitschia confertaspora ATCC 74209]|uniref:dolichol kinase n=1 Tax=Delitschia confertaspora ATCC 74209 TaxID=1513339 RepID=A0A9P4JCG0_9PLEO|nr:hypothetical protein GQ43DRAFT_466933 [Delitschia confertaspora ATCC 74209]